MIAKSILLISSVKLLLVPSYRSTDFEVHRNWLAITNSLPVNKWYVEDTSEWTLDYPPIFAWFEYLLSLIAQLFDKNMLIVQNLNYASFETILFQRLSVIFTDLIYAFGVKQCTSALPKGWHSGVTLPILLISNIGLLMVDHIHFQYNGMMFGILLISIANMMQGNYLSAAFWYTFLLNMKHIYIYLAPAYFIYLLRNYCFKNFSKGKLLLNSLCINNLLKLGIIVTGVFIATFTPFYSQLGMVLSRMFPFKRGLCHAYWAPNVWAVYNVMDKVSAKLASILNIKITYSRASMTGGLVQEFSHAVLPNITPLTAMILPLVAMLPGMIKLWTLDRKPQNFIRYLVICALSSFLFGWHVHEKAILMAVIPLSVLAVLESEDAKIFLLLSTVGHYSLFPLLFTSNLLLVKFMFIIIYSAYAFYSLRNLYPFQLCKNSFPLLTSLESLYLLGLIPLFIYENFIHYYLHFDIKYPFLPLMMTSVYCSFGVIYSWLRYYIYFILKCN